jgi:hypothetical protein
MEKAKRGFCEEACGMRVCGRARRRFRGQIGKREQEVSEREMSL